MYKIQQSKLLALLACLLACLCSTTLFAKTNIDIEINGVDTLLEDNIRLFLSIEQQKNHTLLSEARLHRLHQKAPQEITNALHPFGYYRPVIDSKLTQPASDQWLATYTIDPGPQLPIGEFDFTISEEMSKDPEFQTLIKNIPLHKGDPFNHIEYENTKANLAKLAAERGYFQARFIEHRIDIDLVAYEARIHLNYDGGPRYDFGEIQLNQEVLDPDLLRRYVSFDRGSPYLLSKLVDLQQALNDSDYFSTVEVSPLQPQISNNEIPINVMLTPRKRHRFSVGLGYGTDTGARAKFGWEIPRLNRRGHRFNTEAKISELGNSLSASYRVPVLNPRTDQMVYSAGIVNENTDISESTVQTIGASLNRSIDSWRESISLNYQRESYLIANERGDSTLLLPGVNWNRTWGNNTIYILDGLRFDIGLRGASKKFISDTNFTQLQGGIKAINSLGSRDRIIVQGKLGSTWIQDFADLPSSVRFFAGGAQSVRGYTYQSLGPKDVNGKVIGGNYLLIGNIDFEHSFDNKWGIAVFYDGGNAMDNIDDKLARGAGVGLRWKSPVGSVRIDLASALSLDGKPWRLHINIGPDL